MLTRSLGDHLPIRWLLIDPFNTSSICTWPWDKLVRTTVLKSGRIRVLSPFPWLVPIAFMTNGNSPSAVLQKALYMIVQGGRTLGISDLELASDKSCNLFLPEPNFWIQTKSGHIQGSTEVKIKLGTCKSIDMHHNPLSPWTTVSPSIKQDSLAPMDHDRPGNVLINTKQNLTLTWCSCVYSFHWP